MTLPVRITPAPSLSSIKVASRDAVRRPSHSLISSGSFAEEVVVLRPRDRVSLWFLMFLVVMTNVTLLAGSAVVYHYNNTRGAPLWVFRIYFLSYADGAFLQRNAKIFAIGYTTLVALFTLYALQLVFVSVKRRGFHFGAELTTVTTTRRVSVGRSRSFIAISTSCWTAISRKLRRFRFLLGVRGPYFDSRLLLDHVIELASQTGAAYASSRKISNVGLNLGYAIVICLTSLCPLFFERVYRESLVRQRMACLIADLVLDFVWGTVLPMWTAIPIMELCMNAGPIVDADNILAISRQIERVATLSWPSYVLSVIPFIATLATLIEIQSILREVYDSASAEHQHSRDVTGASQPSMVVLKLRYSVARQERGPLFRVLHALLPLYGITALLVITSANLMHVADVPTASCIHRVYPWFTTHEACVGRRINCTAMGIVGSAPEIEHAIDSFSPVVLDYLMFAYCPDLTISPRIHHLPHLETFVIRDSHLTSWATNAALVSDSFPVLRAIHLIAVTFDEIPMGLVALPLPHSVDWVHLESLANASQLLDAAGDRWARLRFFDCMDCQLTEYPFALKAMFQLSMLALSFNPISHIPEDWNVNADHLHLDALWLDVNTEVATLPDSLWRQTATTEIISLEVTGLTKVPEWLPDVADDGLFVLAANTPLCADPSAIPARVRAIVLCETVY